MQCIFRRESVGAVIILLHTFCWKTSEKSVLVQCKISMSLVCFTYGNEVEGGMQPFIKL